jgi:predicted nucleic acid-binding protein
VITLIDTSVWIDFLRPRSSAGLKRHVAPYLMDSESHVAEPIVFEICRNAHPTEAASLARRFQSLPLLPTPPDLWPRAVVLGQTCRRRGHTPGAMDLLIGAIAQVSKAVLVTMDEEFEKIGEAGGFGVRLLRRPAG